MNQDQMAKALKQAAALTFEDLGFMLPDEVPDREQMNAAPEARVSVAFRGPARGRVVVSVFGGILPEVSANMLGELEAPPPETQRDAFGEIANVITGNLLPRIFGAREVFHLDPPRAERTGAGDLPDDAVTTRLGLEQGRAELALCLEQ